MRILLSFSFWVSVTGLAYPLCSPSCNSSKLTCGKVTIFLTCFMLILCGVEANILRTCLNGTILPREPFFIEGENVTLVCNSNQVKSSRNLKFIRGVNKIEINNKYITRLNRTAIRLTFPVTAEEIASHVTSMQYRCIKRTSKRDTCIDNVYVQLDYKPQPPIDVECRNYDFSSIKCTWSLGVDYVHERAMNVTCGFMTQYYDHGGDVDLLYKSDNEAADWQPCPHQVNNSCIWAMKDYTDPLVLYVSLSVSNSRNKVRSSPLYLKFNKYDIIVPGPVEELVVRKTENLRCVTLDWTPSKAGMGRDFVYNVTYQSDCSETKSVEVTYNASEEMLDSSEICGLNPYTVYNYTVSGRILAPKAFDNTTSIRKGLWSPSKSITDRTESDVIDVNPQTSPGLYEIDTEQSIDKDGYATVRFYWKPLPVCEQHDNSGKVSYKVLAYNISKNSTSEKFFEQISVPQDHDRINIELNAGNSIGGPNFTEVVTVFPSKMSPQPSELVIQYNDTNSDCKMFAIILTENLESVLYHTVVWCKGTLNCQEPINWQKLEVNQTRYEFPQDVCKSEAYRFGLITHSNHENQRSVTDTGIRWTKCIYNIGKVPTESLPDVIVIPGPRFEVQWSRYDCDVIPAFVFQYKVSHCKTSHFKDSVDCKCSGDVKTVTVNRNVTKYIDENIPVNTGVCVWVTAITPWGPAPPSQPRFGLLSNMEKEDSDSTVYLVVFGSILFAILVVVVIVRCRVYCRKRAAKLKESTRVALPITPDDIREAQEVIGSRETFSHIGTEERIPLYHSNGYSGLSSGVFTETPTVESGTSDFQSLLGNSHTPLLNGYQQTEGFSVGNQSIMSENSDEDEDEVDSNEQNKFIAVRNERFVDGEEEGVGLNQPNSIVADSTVSSFPDVGNTAVEIEAESEEIGDHAERVNDGKHLPNVIYDDKEAVMKVHVRVRTEGGNSLKDKASGVGETTNDLNDDIDDTLELSAKTKGDLGILDGVVDNIDVSSNDTIELNAKTAHDNELVEEASEVDVKANVETGTADLEFNCESDGAIFGSSSGNLIGAYNNPSEFVDDSDSDDGETPDMLEGGYHQSLNLGDVDSDELSEEDESTEVETDIAEDGSDNRLTNADEVDEDISSSEPIDEYAKCTTDHNEHCGNGKIQNGLNGVHNFSKNNWKIPNGFHKQKPEVQDQIRASKPQPV